jgi:hypothetical protein
MLALGGRRALFIKSTELPMLYPVKLEAVVDQHHQLHLQLPPDTPVGDAELIVLVTPTAPATSTAPMASLLAFFAELDADGRPRLSAEEVDRWIEEERNDWE